MFSALVLDGKTLSDPKRTFAVYEIGDVPVRRVHAKRMVCSKLPCYLANLVVDCGARRVLFHQGDAVPHGDGACVALALAHDSEIHCGQDLAS